jgi:hypothetical protein
LPMISTSVTASLEGHVLQKILQAKPAGGWAAFQNRSPPDESLMKPDNSPHRVHMQASISVECR